jgi:hypothetical protein
MPTHYKSKKDIAREANLKELHNFAASCQSLYFKLRNTTLFTFFRSNFFDEYKNYASIANHARVKPQSRTAVCFELLNQIRSYRHQKKMHGITHKITLSQNVQDVLNKNKSFFTFLCHQYPDFMTELNKQNSKSYSMYLTTFSILTKKQEVLIISRNLTNSLEGNHAITNLDL